MFTMKEFLNEEVKPALGCTEPGAVALAVARAAEELEKTAERASITVSDSIFKNGVAVGIPGTNGLKGNAIAAALALVCGRSEYGLEVLKDATGNDVSRAQALVETGNIELCADMTRHGVYVRAEVASGGERAVCIIEDSHTGISRVEHDGEIIFERKTSLTVSTRNISSTIATMDYTDLVSLVETMDAEDVNYVMKGVEMNLNISEYGFSEDIGLGLGNTVRKMAGERYGQDLASQIKAICAAASDARMAGVPLPVMSSAGSGNHGITAILPVYQAGLFYDRNREEIARAIAFSHLSTSFIKSRMGRLSPVCGCAVAAGAGAAAGIVHLLDGSTTQSVRAMEIVLGNLVGMVCDGAKETCALKVGTGATEAYYAAMLALDGKELDGAQGIVDPESISRTVDNAVLINTRGMKDVDSVIIDFVSKRIVSSSQYSDRLP